MNQTNRNYQFSCIFAIGIVMQKSSIRSSSQSVWKCFNYILVLFLFSASIMLQTKSLIMSMHETVLIATLFGWLNLFHSTFISFHTMRVHLRHSVEREIEINDHIYNRCQRVRHITRVTDTSPVANELKMNRFFFFVFSHLKANDSCKILHNNRVATCDCFSARLYVVGI